MARGGPRKLRPIIAPTAAKNTPESAEGPAQNNRTAVKADDGSNHPVERIKVTVIYGSLTQVSSPMAVVPRYQGVPLVGPAQDFDIKLDNWLTRIVDIGIVNSILGQLAFLPLKDLHLPGKDGFEQKSARVAAESLRSAVRIEAGAIAPTKAVAK